MDADDRGEKGSNVRSYLAVKTYACVVGCKRLRMCLNDHATGYDSDPNTPMVYSCSTQYRIHTHGVFRGLQHRSSPRAVRDQREASVHVRLPRMQQALLQAVSPADAQSQTHRDDFLLCKNKEIPLTFPVDSAFGGSQESDLTAAESKLNDGEKPFNCRWPNCQKKFARSDELVRHHNMHQRNLTKLQLAI
ncbi:hypothetical protein F2P81_006838 [Scophthalmus maximus]|uniref:C2H2-type domain-containing protein n=1 Tax=Scophthalmus maximus TaxID=52904 RepID=A0A6A4TAP6_SCOMX|nr:hypothetical protein F2P81_006838 [Scophthalmus maximus]